MLCRALTNLRSIVASVPCETCKQKRQQGGGRWLHVLHLCGLSSTATEQALWKCTNCSVSCSFISLRSLSTLRTVASPHNIGQSCGQCFTHHDLQLSSQLRAIHCSDRVYASLTVFLEGFFFLMKLTII